ncbi:hypothetical protein F4680DRAFT_426942 [Xylaria scruposa]|nr:hypothetical protein F4680DRAFT_426942 [Xylaria scruposa]
MRPHRLPMPVRPSARHLPDRLFVSVKPARELDLLIQVIPTEMAAATTYLCMAVAQQTNPNWTGPPVTDHLPPSLSS